MKTKKEYISPALKVLAVNTEKGFAVSTLLTLHLFHDMENEWDNADQQAWEENTTTFGGSAITWND